MATVGVWGLGAMGMPILEALSEIDDAVGYDLSHSRSESGALTGARMAASAPELVAEADVVVVVLPGAEAQRRALLPDDQDSPIRMMRPGALLLELTSGDPRLSRDIAAMARDAGVHYVSAPMSGGPSAARRRSLGFCVAGAEETVAVALPWLRHLASPTGIVIVGTEPAMAQTVKLAINAVWFGQAALVTEALLFTATAGVDPGRMQQILDRSAAGGAFTRDYLPRLLEGDYVDAFGIDGVIEQLRTVVDVAAAERTPAGTVAHVLALHREAREEFGSVTAELLVARLLESQAGMQLRFAGR